MEERFRTKVEQNWLKCSIAKDRISEVLAELADIRFKAFYTHIRNDIYSNHGILQTETCSTCSDPSTQCNLCSKIVTRIWNYHRFKQARLRGPSWKNTDISKWCTESWELAKCYMPPTGYKDKASAGETDFNGIIGAIYNCTWMQNYFTDDLSQQTNICTKARDVVNELRHTNGMNIDDRVMFSFFDCLLNLLYDTALPNSFKPAVDARTYLIRLQLDIMPLTEMEVNDTLQKRYKDEGLVLVSRTEWYAQSSREAAQYMTMPFGHVFIHHTTMNECFSREKGVIEMRKIQHIHQDINGWADIGYNFVIGQDGKVYMGRGWDRVGTHTLGWNNKSISFAFTGNFTEKLPTDDALNALEASLVLGVKLGKLTPDFKLHGHRDARPETKSSGQTLYDQFCKHEHYEPIGPNILTFSPQSRV